MNVSIAGFVDLWIHRFTDMQIHWFMIHRFAESLIHRFAVVLVCICNWSLMYLLLALNVLTAALNASAGGPWLYLWPAWNAFAECIQSCTLNVFIAGPWMCSWLNSRIHGFTASLIHCQIMDEPPRETFTTLYSYKCVDNLHYNLFHSAMWYCNLKSSLNKFNIWKNWHLIAQQMSQWPSGSFISKC